MRKMVEVQHAGIEGTATVPESALKHMPGWKPVTGQPATKKTTAAKKAAANQAGDGDNPKEQ